MEHGLTLLSSKKKTSPGFTSTEEAIDRADSGFRKSEPEPDCKEDFVILVIELGHFRIRITC